MELVGYVDRWSVRAGDTIRLFVSCSASEYRAELVRLIHGDTNPQGPGLKFEHIPSPISRRYAGCLQRIHTGSYLIVEAAPEFDCLAAVTVQTRIWPTAPERGGQGLVTRWSPTADVGFGLLINGDGELELRLSSSNGEAFRLRSDRKLQPRSWHFVAATFDTATGQALLYSVPEYFSPVEAPEIAVRGTYRVAGGAFGAPGSPLLFGAHYLRMDRGREVPEKVYDGKIERPRLFDRALSLDELRRLRLGGLGDLKRHLIADWDFARDTATSKVTDCTGRGLHGRTVNRPARAVTSHNWSGQFDRVHDMPLEYDAIYFHEDDLEDVRWEPSVEFTVPTTLRSGVYAVQLKSAEAERFVTFFVRPHAGEATAKAAVLVPTLTYLAYQNKQPRNIVFTGGMAPRSNPQLQREDFDYIARNKLTCTYNTHSDGSAVFYATTQCPNLTTMNPVHRYPLFDAPHCLGAELHLIDWLETKGFRYDVLTDHDLHREGAELLMRYSVVILGSHPEYWTAAMLDGFEAYVQQGGRAMYLGGNAICFVAAIDDSGQLAEIRRNRWAWGFEPGEGRLSLTGEMGGQWWDRGRSPHKHLGVGTSSMGFDRGSAYRRCPASYDPRAAFIFEAIGEDLIGDFPTLVLGYGAAGYEIDRADYTRGTPRHALVLATSVGFSDAYQVLMDDVREVTPDLGGTQSPLVRSDMVFFETPNNGAVFSVGSISWSSALSYNNYSNNVSRITENVLRAFMADGPLPKSA
jgi:N,N-dimethylformamidase